MNDKLTTFWVVVKDGNRMECSYRHLTLDSAMNEARRLSENTGGQRFYVFEMVGCMEIERQPIGWKTPVAAEPEF